MPVIEYPYIPEGRTIEYVQMENSFIQQAKAYACEHSLDKVIQTGSVIVKDGEVMGIAANGSDFHENNECERVKQNIPTGEGYELCEGCHPKNHSERRAIEDAKSKGNDTKDADLYLWGHWWCCKPCWDAMIEAGIRQVYLAEGSHELFDKNHPENIIGRQCNM